MKAIISTLLLMFTLSFSFGQSKAIVKSPSDLTSIKDSGKGFITLPADMTAEMVNSKAKYYDLYFKVNFDENSKLATINMVTNDARSRQVIIRFLAACSIQEVQVGDEVINRDLLFEKYLK